MIACRWSLAARIDGSSGELLAAAVGDRRVDEAWPPQLDDNAPASNTARIRTENLIARDRTPRRPKAGRSRVRDEKLCGPRSPLRMSAKLVDQPEDVARLVDRVPRRQLPNREAELSAAHAQRLKHGGRAPRQVAQELPFEP